MATMLTMGTSGALSALLWYFMPAAVAYDARKEAERREAEEKEELA